LSKYRFDLTDIYFVYALASVKQMCFVLQVALHSAVMCLLGTESSLQRLYLCSGSQGLIEFEVTQRFTAVFAKAHVKVVCDHVMAPHVADK